MEIAYRIATDKDIKIIQEIAQKTWFVTYEPILGKEQPQFMFDLIFSDSGLLEQMQNGQVFTIQSFNNQTVGFASYSVKNQHEQVFKLNKLYLDPSFQGAGLGKKLIIEVENQVKNLGAKILDLNVNRFNKAIHFYEIVGFKIIQEEDIPIGNFYMNDYVMRKNL